ncbi:MAG: hypothetical protein NTU61_03790 [Candidatus Altiarchaeota archaeon]|nr:hypothetical protein [Candidatus Altiarchaeota archaeon]
MRRYVVFFLMLAAVSASATQVPLNEEWSRHMLNGVNSVQLLDLDNKNGPEIYAITYNQMKTTVYIMGFDGSETDNFIIEPKMKYLYPTEEIKIAALCDLDRNGVLDIISGSEAHTGSINKHILYRTERTWYQDLGKYSTDMKWKYEESDLTTSIHCIDYNGDGSSEIITSDRDGEIRVMDPDGNVIENRTLDAAIWDMKTILGTEGFDFAVGMFRKLSFLKAVGKSWNYGVDDRFDRVYVEDINRDGVTEVLGVSSNTLHVFDMDGGLRWSYSAQGMGEVAIVNIGEINYSSIAVASKKQVIFLNKDGVETGTYDVGENVLALRYFSSEEKYGLIIGTDSSLKYYSMDLRDLKRVDGIALENLALQQFKSENFTDAIHLAENAIRIFTGLEDEEALGRAYGRRRQEEDRGRAVRRSRERLRRKQAGGGQDKGQRG